MSSPLLFKLGILGIKTVTKPVTKRVTQWAQNHDRFKQFCVNVGKLGNKVSFQMSQLTNGKIATYRPLKEEVAVKVGAELLSETIIFSVAGVIIYIETNRGKSKMVAEDHRMQGEIDRLRLRIVRLERQFDELPELTPEPDDDSPDGDPAEEAIRAMAPIADFEE